MKKTFLLDTNVLMYEPRALFMFEDNEVVIPLIVLDELDKHKNGNSQASKHARMAIRSLDELRALGNLHDGVLTEKGGMIRVELNHKDQVPFDLDPSKADNRIISVALGIKKSAESKVVVVTKDINLRVKCDALGVCVEDFSSDSVVKNLDYIYAGTIELAVSSKDIDILYNTGTLEVEDATYLYPNQYVLLRSDTNPKHSSLARFDGTVLKKVKSYSNVWGISPRNKEQTYALDALFNPDIKLVTIIGKAGTGKTLIAAAAGVSQILDNRIYKRIVMSRPIMPLGRDIGFLPGPQPLDAKILTPNGWTTMGEIKIGDYVVGRDGNPTKVLGVYPKGRKKVYKIITTDNTSTECCMDHLWYTKTKEEKKRNKAGGVRSTKEILNTLKDKNNKLNHYLPRNKEVMFNKQSLAIPPYLMGCILGDGSISNSISVCNVDDDIIKRVKEDSEHLGLGITLSPNTIIYTFKDYLYNNKPARKIKVTNVITGKIDEYNSIGMALKYIDINRSTLQSRCDNRSIIDNIKYEFVNDSQPRWSNKIKNELHLLGLSGTKSNTKFIPEIYKKSDINDRIAILQGLMDTDGTIKTNGEASFCTTSFQLAKDLVDVVRSLGGRACIKKRNRVGKKSKYNNSIIETKLISYEFTVSMPNHINPFYVERKSKYHKCKYIYDARIQSIEENGTKEVQCILVDNTDHLYITDDFIVTHNTIGDKMDPWMAPLYDNLDLIFSDKGKYYIETLEEEGKIEIQPLTYIRGRSLPGSYVLVDECLSKDHLIQMHDGSLKKIQNIVMGDQVMSFDLQNNCSRPAEVEGIMSRMANELIKIKTPGSNLECTTNHPLYISSDFGHKKKMAKDIKVGDFILSPRVSTHIETNYIDPDIAHFIGMILSDGHVERKSTIKVAVSKDKEYFDKYFRKGVSVLCSEDKSISFTNKRGDFIVALNNVKAITKFCQEFGVPSGKKSTIIKVPNQMFTANIDAIRRFISSCYDAEGDINNSVGSIVINYNTCSKEMALGMQHLLSKFGVKSSLLFIKKRKKNHSDKYRIYMSGINAYEFYTKIGFTMSRKQNVLKEYFDQYTPLDQERIPVANILRKRLKESGVKSRDPMFSSINGSKTIYRYNINATYGHMFSESELEFINNFNFNEVKVVKLKRSKKGIEVYDFKVKDTGTFYVNGLLSSNCQQLTRHEIKALITRIGEGSKVILTGDIEQIDTPYLDSTDNGLSCVVEIFKDDPIAAHIQLTKGERSELATLAAEKL